MPQEQMIVVRLDHVRLGLPLPALTELQPMVAEEPVTAAPELVSGFVNLRGRMVPLLDLRRRLGLPERHSRASDRLCFLDLGGRLVGVRVDAAEGIATVSPDSVEPLRGLRPGNETGRTVAATADGVLVLLDVEGFLSSDELDGIDQALAALARDPA